MKIVDTVKGFQELRRSLSQTSIGFIPTMGALHQGHLSLIQRAKMENEVVVVSIYVNETQFNDSTDLKNYPRDLERDLESLKKLKVDYLFLPNYQEIYPDDYRYKVTENKDSLELCGKDRPGHFDGVLTVVLKLFNIVRPQKAYFGEKDFQQKKLIKDMVEALFLETEIVSCPTQRDELGLALSSRNKKLSMNELTLARKFAQALKNTKDLQNLKDQLIQNNIAVDYLVEKQNRRYGAVRIGNVRLIDNVEI